MIETRRPSRIACDYSLRMSWKPEVDEIERLRALARQQGGAEAVERQHARGRLTVRERIEALVDPASFREHGELAGESERDANGELRSFAPANVVVGMARIDGRQVVVGGDDFTIRGGAYTPVGLRKGLYADELAIRRRVPLVRLLEGGGASVTGATGVRGRSGYDLTASSPLNVLCMETLASVPVVCAALGPVAGFPAARLVASHFSLMTRQTAQVLTGGPALVERALGEKLSKEELGGAEIHLRSGVVQNVAEDEAGCLAADPPLPVLPARERVGHARRSPTAAIRRSARRKSCSRSSRATAGARTRSGA